MIRLSVAIMGHPSRIENIEKLRDELSRSTEVHVQIDHDEEGTWPTAKKCWQALDGKGSHALVLQDDVILCRDFYVGACRAIRHRPASSIAFYANQKSIEEAQEQGKSWARVSGVWGQAQCIPTSFIPPFLRFSEVHPKPKEDCKCDDWLLGEFLRLNKQHVWATVPSLVEHGAPNASLIGFSNKNKIARWFIGKDTSALSVDWRIR